MPPQFTASLSDTNAFPIWDQQFRLVGNPLVKRLLHLATKLTAQYIRQVCQKAGLPPGARVSIAKLASCYAERSIFVATCTRVCWLRRLRSSRDSIALANLQDLTDQTIEGTAIDCDRLTGFKWYFGLLNCAVDFASP